jgi:hypothetical protein
VRQETSLSKSFLYPPTMDAFLDGSLQSRQLFGRCETFRMISLHFRGKIVTIVLLQGILMNFQQLHLRRKAENA